MCTFVALCAEGNADKPGIIFCRCESKLYCLDNFQCRRFHFSNFIEIPGVPS